MRTQRDQVGLNIRLDCGVTQPNIRSAVALADVSAYYRPARSLAR